MNKKFAFLCKTGVVFLLLVCMVCSMVTPAFASYRDLTNSRLKEALQLSNSDVSNYNKNYTANLPVEFSKNKNSYYVALGSGTVNGAYGVGRNDAIYADLVTQALGIKTTSDYLGDETLVAQDIMTYIADYKAEIQKADLITYQLDAADFAMESISDAIQWEKYLSGSALTNMKKFRSEMTVELTADLGEKNAKAVAETLEGMLFQCVVYNIETVKAIKEIRKLNSDAAILVLGLYNPYRGLSAVYQGSTFDISGWIDEVIKLSNVHLLKNTMNMDKVGFIDTTGVKVVGFSSVTLTDDDTGTKNLAMKLVRDKKSQYADKTGHEHLKSQIVSALAEPCKHSKTTVANVKAATCKEAGYSGDTVCTACNKVIKAGKATAKAAHAYGSWTQTKAPTCTAKGEKERVCSVCSVKDVQAVDMLAHTWDAGTVTKEPTCTAKGSKKLTCTVCQKTSTEAIAALGHTWDAGTVVKEPGCESTGSKKVTCTTCQKTSTEEIAALGHTWDAGTVTTAPGCESTGVKTYSCTVTGCTGSKIEDLPAAGHTYGDHVSNNDATCQQDGTKTATCTACGAQDTVADTGSKLPHDYVDGICSNCGANKADEPKEGPSVILIVVLAVAAVACAAGGAAYFLLVVKKR